MKGKESRNVALKDEKGRVYIVDGGKTFRSNSPDIREGLVEGVVEHSDGSFEASNHTVDKEVVLPEMSKGVLIEYTDGRKDARVYPSEDWTLAEDDCVVLMYVKFSGDSYPVPVVMLGDSGDVVIWVDGVYCEVSGILGQLKEYEISGGKDDGSPDFDSLVIQRFWSSYLDQEFIYLCGNTQKTSDTKAKLVELWLNGCGREAKLYALDGFIFCCGEDWYLYKCGNRTWIEGKMSSTCSKLLESLVGEYENKLSVCVNCGYEEIVGFAEELGIVLSSYEWVSIPNGMCYRKFKVCGKDLTVYLAGGKYWNAERGSGIYERASRSRRECEEAGMSNETLRSLCGWN